MYTPSLQNYHHKLVKAHPVVHVRTCKALQKWYLQQIPLRYNFTIISTHPTCIFSLQMTFIPVNGVSISNELSKKNIMCKSLELSFVLCSVCLCILR